MKKPSRGWQRRLRPGIEGFLSRVAAEDATAAGCELVFAVRVRDAIALIFNLVVATRHPMHAERPGANGAEVCHELIHQLIDEMEESGLHAHAEVAREICAMRPEEP